jgi:uncharacterized protein (DUF1330 family)
MPAYLIAQPEEIYDPAGLQQYVEQVIPLMATFGGRYIITSSAVTVLEGEGATVGAAVAEFPSMEQLRAFWAAPAYAPLRALRQRSLRVRIIAVDVPPTS